MSSLKELSDLSGRVALITGGAGHVGASLCDALGELGAAVAILDLDEAETSRICADLERSHGVATLPVAGDLADEAFLKNVPNAVRDELGRLDILVNCAALVGTSSLTGWAVPFEQQDANTWRLALEVNLTAPFILAQAAAQLLAESGKGSIINIGSIYGMVGPDWRMYEGTALGNPAAYAASKGGLLQLTRWLATTLAPMVRVNSVSLGGVWRDHSDQFLSRYVEHTPMRRMATEEDVKGAVAYLATDLSAYVTGQNLAVDGGWTSW